MSVVKISSFLCKLWNCLNRCSNTLVLLFGLRIHVRIRNESSLIDIVTVVPRGYPPEHTPGKTSAYESFSPGSSPTSSPKHGEASVRIEYSSTTPDESMVSLIPEPGDFKQTKVRMWMKSRGNSHLSKYLTCLRSKLGLGLLRLNISQGWTW